MSDMNQHFNPDMETEEEKFRRFFHNRYQVPIL
jgi:hypothetical protein